MRPRAYLGIAALIGLPAVLGPFAIGYWRDSRATELIERYGGAISMPTPDVTVWVAVPGVSHPKSFGDAQLAGLVPVLPDVWYFAGLDLGGTSVTDAGIAGLGALRQLRRLNVGGTPVTAAGLMQLRGLPNLSEVDVSAGQLSPAEVQSLHAAMPTLTIIPPQQPLAVW